MTTTAWGFMLTVWAIIVGFTVYCFWKLLTSERRLDGDEPRGDAIEPPGDGAFRA